MKAAEFFDPRVDAYINKSATFAQPILEHLRKLFHKGCPQVEEAIKWSMPFFTYKGQLFGHIAGFKQHCSFGLIGSHNRSLTKAKFEQKDGMGIVGKITSLDDLPSDKEMLQLIREAAVFVDEGGKTMARTKKAAKPVPEVPAEFAVALKKNKTAQKVFKDFSPSAQREYIEWIDEAKREETKQKRIVQAVEQIAEGKQRNWKYHNL
ncbi:YdeI/OmpD-associated family protein [Edaphobacter albus]|uniref:YdeI/OmpD-associated family protein n=1 Tax=Edaphobacter sp. 4G125 TaxID=2763071 RepID=UPI0016483ED5|nr:YdeI/OmpD-associated family protein [Edaphobacter sp. 4G125]QNI37152.1 YdeI/OmpD-associated family protein [Edaphobacter sp. 4G125]